MNIGKLFVGAILLLVAIYLFVSQTDFTVKYFGGGMVALLALFVFIMPSFKKQVKKKK